MKKKIFAIALAAMLFALAIAGSSVAYFTDTEKATNVFTAGDVDIQLTYTDIDSNVKVYELDLNIVNYKENGRVIELVTSKSIDEFKESIKEILKPHLEDLCEDCKMRYIKNPLRIVIPPRIGNCLKLCATLRPLLVVISS